MATATPAPTSSLVKPKSCSTSVDKMGSCTANSFSPGQPTEKHPRNCAKAIQCSLRTYTLHFPKQSSSPTTLTRTNSPFFFVKTSMEYHPESRCMALDKQANGNDRMKWVDVPDCFCFHLWNSWEESLTDEIVVIGSCMTPPDSIFNECDQGLNSVFSEIRLTGKSTKRPIISYDDQVNLEARMVNRNKLGRKTPYAYLAIAEPWPKVSGFSSPLEWSRNSSTGTTSVSSQRPPLRSRRRWPYSGLRAQREGLEIGAAYCQCHDHEPGGLR